MTTCNRCGVSLYYPNNVIGKESVCTNCFRKEKEKMFVYRYLNRSREIKTIEYDNIYSAMARVLWELDYGSGSIIDIRLPTAGVLDINAILNWLEEKGWE